MNLLTLSYSGRLSAEDEALLCEAAASAGKRIGAEVLVLPSGIASTLTHDPSALHDRLDRLATAIEALAASNMALVERLTAADAEEPGLDDADPPWPAPISRKG